MFSLMSLLTPNEIWNISTFVPDKPQSDVWKMEMKKLIAILMVVFASYRTIGNTKVSGAVNSQ